MGWNGCQTLCNGLVQIHDILVGIRGTGIGLLDEGGYQDLAKRLRTAPPRKILYCN